MLSVEGALKAKSTELQETSKLCIWRLQCAHVQGLFWHTGTIFPDTFLEEGTHMASWAHSPNFIEINP